jgi:transketolase
MNYEEASKELRKKIVKLKHGSQGGHLGSALSCIDILNMLYFSILKIDPKNPLADNRDRFIFSKGHAAAALYAVLCQRGFFLESELAECVNGSKIAGHSVKDSLPGIEVSTGSLGHGLPMGNGMAIAAKKDGKSHNVVVMISDGECDEGTTWESALFAAQNRLDNLTVIIDYNKIQSFGTVKEVMDLEPLAKKWESFGFEVAETNGHDFNNLEKAFSKIGNRNIKPKVIICHTIKGKGIASIENTVESHYHKVTGQEYQEFIKELS